jgi:hypothetical protein
MAPRRANTGVLASTNFGVTRESEKRQLKINFGTGNYSTFTYDGLSRLTAINETISGTVTGTKQFVWSAGLMCEARNGSSTTIAQYFPLGQTISGTNYFYSRDYISSIREVSDGSGRTA